jgi:hypothetical protein
MSEICQHIWMTRLTTIACCALIAVAMHTLLATPSAHASVTSEQISTATYPLAIDIDSAGNVWIGYADGPMTPKGVTVIPSSSGTLFGQSVTAGVETRIFDINNVQGILRSPDGHLFVATDSGGLYVATATNTNVFNVPTTANTLTSIPSSTFFRGGLAMDTAGNLFGGRKAGNGVAVLPVASGALFGVAVTANTPGVLISSPEWTGDVAVDSSGNLFIGSWFGGSQGVHVLPRATGTLYGQAVTGNVLTRLVSASNVSGIDIDAADNIYFSQWSRNQLTVLTPETRTVLGQTFTANMPAVLVGGSGDQGLAVAADGSSLVSGGSSTVRIRSASEPSDDSSQSGSGGLSSSPQTFSLQMVSENDAVCSKSSEIGNAGTWITLPNANDCTPPATKQSAKLLGWATTPNFPVAIAQRQVDNGWGTYETFNSDGQLTGVFIPAGGATFLSATGNLYSIWSE